MEKEMPKLRYKNSDKPRWKHGDIIPIIKENTMHQVGEKLLIKGSFRDKEHNEFRYSYQVINHEGTNTDKNIYSNERPYRNINTRFIHSICVEPTPTTEALYGSRKE